MGILESGLLLKLALAALAVVGAVLGAVAIRFVSSRSKGNLFWLASEKLTFGVVNIVSAAWVELQQTVSEITADGKVTPDEYRLLLDKAIGHTKQKLGQEVLSHYQKQLGTIGQPINDLVDGIVTQVVNVKLGAKAPVLGVTPPILPGPTPHP